VNSINTASELIVTLLSRLTRQILGTKINKGTVGFFGVVSALTQIYLKNKEQKPKK
jgi:hypothetical protein